MGIDDLMGDDVFIVSPSGERIGPVKASVQGNKIFINDERLIIEEGGKILRPLPNGKSESYSILQVNFHKDPFGDLSHYEIRTRKDSSLVASPVGPTINITHSQGIQIGDGNVQHVIGSLQMLAHAIDSTDAPPAQKADAKAKLKDFLSHPLTVAVLGSAATSLLNALQK